MPVYRVSFRILARADNEEEARAKAAETIESRPLQELGERADYEVEEVEDDPTIR